MTNLDLAKSIAETAHKGQKRKNGEDYINHCIRVSEAVKDFGEDYQIVGLLHDVIEDSNITFNDFRDEGFSEDILQALAFITKLKDETYLSYILEIKHYIGVGSQIAKQVKIADLKDNLNGAKGTLKDKYELSLYILTGEITEHNK